MKKIHFVSCLAIISMPFIASAQGTLQISTLAEPTTGNVSIASDSWVGQRFYIFPSDTTPYTLDRVELLMDTASGTPSDLGLSIYDGNGVPGDGPQTSLETLTGAMDPASGGVYSYASSGLTLTSANDYYVVVTAASPLAIGSYTWSSTVPTSFTMGSWKTPNDQSVSSDGLNWAPVSRERTLQMAIFATPVPEPTTGALAALGVGALMVLRRCPKGFPAAQPLFEPTGQP